MADHRIAMACAQRGYIRMYNITIDGLDEITPKDILREHSPIKSLTGCDSLGLFASLNNANEIMVLSIATSKSRYSSSSLAVDRSQ